MEMNILNWSEVYNTLSSQYYQGLNGILNDSSLSASGKDDARKLLSDGLRSDWAKLEIDYKTKSEALAKELSSLQDKAPSRPVPTQVEIDLENREANLLLSNLAVTEGKRAFLDVIKEALKGSKQERSAFTIHFHKIIDLTREIWNDIDSQDRIEVTSALKTWYREAQESLKTQAELTHEAKVKELEGQASELNGAYEMARRTFERITPEPDTGFDPWKDNKRAADKTPIRMYGEMY